MTSKRLTVRSRAAWRAWLERHHDATESIWVVSYKRDSGGPYVPYDDLVDEAIAFGWVDSRPNALDERRSMRLFSPRRAGSGWSAVNKRRVARLIREGRMHAAGLRAVRAAKRDGSWAKLDRVDAHVVPDDLARALRRDAAARRHFDAFPPSSKKIILEWIGNAKRPETRAARIARTVTMAHDNLRANHYRQPG